MKTKEELDVIAAKVAEDYKKLRSLDVEVRKNDNNDNYYLAFLCERYRWSSGDNFITNKQFEYITNLCKIKSRSNLRHLNKWCASAIISTIKENDLDYDQVYVVS